MKKANSMNIVCRLDKTGNANRLEFMVLLR